MTADNTSIQDHLERLRSLSFSIGTYRPPSEGGSASLLLRVTENCPWNKCTFCEMYKAHRFVYRPVEEIKADIDRVAAIRDEITAISCKLGMGGAITRDVAAALLAEGCDPGGDLAESASFITVFNWLARGGGKGLLQDANPRTIGPPEAVSVSRHPP